MAAPHFTFERQPNEFTAIPGSPFAYWAPKDCINVFTRNEHMNRDGRLVVSTNPLNADFRFVRLWWEPSPDHLGVSWRPWAKGGAYSPYYYDIDTVISLSPMSVSHTSAFYEPKTAGALGRFRPKRAAILPTRFDLAARRSQRGYLGPSHARGVAFSPRRPPSVVPDDESDELLASPGTRELSSCFRYLSSKLQMAFGSLRSRRHPTHAYSKHLRGRHSRVGAPGRAARGHSNARSTRRTKRRTRSFCLLV